MPLHQYPEPDWTRGVWAYGEEGADDLRKDDEPVCPFCEGPVGDRGWCDGCQEFSEVEV